MKGRGDDESRTVLALLMTAHRLEINEPHLAWLDSMRIELAQSDGLDHSSLIGASAPTSSSASAR